MPRTGTMFTAKPSRMGLHTMDDERTLVVKAIRLDKWLANAGMGTRTEVKKPSALRASRSMARWRKIQVSTSCQEKTT
ncbi:hypothetical protein [Alicyclobacillus fastidiosus]|uniref:hypothetical protein n=1 Tax=Alicyclobacillus fastidiosus TaxID=392011 RepID=UPI0032AED5DC